MVVLWTVHCRNRRICNGQRMFISSKQIVLNSSDQIVLIDIADQKDFVCVVYCGTSTFEHSNVSLALNTCVQLHSL